MRAGGRDGSPGKLSMLFLIVQAVALVLFRSQYVTLPFDKPRLIQKISLKLYRQLHVVSQDCNSCMLLVQSIKVHFPGESFRHNESQSVTLVNFHETS